MSASEETRAPALPFATTNYTEDQEGVLRAVLPSRCVYATEEQTCVIDPDCAALTLRLRHFLRLYNDTPHETLDGDTPQQRWEQGRPLRFPEDHADLHRRFVVRAMHKVSADHVIKADGRQWEAPRGTAGQQVEVARHLLDDRLWVLHDGRMVELAVLDPHANATEPRGGGHRTPPPLPGEGVPDTAASIRFAHDLRPLVDADGGFRDPQPPDDPPDQEHH